MSKIEESNNTNNITKENLNEKLSNLNDGSLSSGEIPKQKFNLNAKEYIPKNSENYDSNRNNAANKKSSFYSSNYKKKNRHSDWINVRSSKFHSNCDYNNESNPENNSNNNKENIDTNINNNNSNWNKKESSNPNNKSPIIRNNSQKELSNEPEKIENSYPIATTTKEIVSLTNEIIEEPEIELEKETKNEDSKVNYQSFINQNEKNNQDKLNERAKLRLLVRFNCGKCQKKYSKILIPTMFFKSCERCNQANSELVVLRCNDNQLFGGYLCTHCEYRFLSKVEFNDFKTITPFCFDCNKVVKVYQILLNRSKISVRNEKVFICLKCHNKETQSFYQPYGWKKASNMKPICCNIPMEYSHLNRSLKHYLLDEQGRSEMYSTNWNKGMDSRIDNENKDYVFNSVNSNDFSYIKNKNSNNTYDCYANDTSADYKTTYRYYYDYYQGNPNLNNRNDQWNSYKNKMSSIRNKFNGKTRGFKMTNKIGSRGKFYKNEIQTNKQ